MVAKSGEGTFGGGWDIDPDCGRWRRGPEGPIADPKWVPEPILPPPVRSQQKKGVEVVMKTSKKVRIVTILDNDSDSD